MWGTLWWASTTFKGRVQCISPPLLWWSSDYVFSSPRLSLSSTLKNMLALKNSKTGGHLLIVSYLVLCIKFDFFFNFAPWHLIFKSNSVLILLIVICFFFIFFLIEIVFFLFYLSTFDFIFFLYQFSYSFFLILSYPFFFFVNFTFYYFVFSSFIFSLSSISKNVLALEKLRKRWLFVDFTLFDS